MENGSVSTFPDIYSGESLTGSTFESTDIKVVIIIKMNSDSLKNGIVGVMLGAGILAGSGYNPADVDSVTGVTYEEINRNPELDVYYIVETASIVCSA